MGDDEKTRFQKSFPVSWQELHRDAKALAWRLSEKGEFTAVVAITRGGLVPAAIVARELEMRLIDTVCVASYEHQTQGEVKILKAPEGDGSGLIIVDDLVDTGSPRCASCGSSCPRRITRPSMPSPKASRWSIPTSPR